MSVFDVTKDNLQEIEEIQWCGVEEWNIIQQKDSLGGVYFKGIEISQYNHGLVNDKEQAENLIKALQKAIELGWVK